MIKIYTTPTCPWCKRTKEFLEKKGIKYKEINVSSDRKAAEEMVKISGQYGVPVLDINGKVVVGFDPDKIEELIEIKNK